MVQRTTRKLGLTEAGRVLFERVMPAVSELAEAEQAVGGLRGEPRGLLRVAAPMSMGFLGSTVAEYLALCPEVTVEMVCSDRVVNLIEERFDVAIRAGTLGDSSLVARRLGTARSTLVAAPTYVKRHGMPKTPAELVNHAFHRVWSWHRAAPVDSRVRRNARRGSSHPATGGERLGAGQRSCARRIWDWLAAQLSCRNHIRDERLVAVLPDFCSPEIPVHAVYPTRRQLSPKVVAFVELLAERIQFHDG